MSEQRGSLDLNDFDLSHLRRTFMLATQARQAGHRPFGAVLTHQGTAVCEAGSTQVAQGDPTAHAEMNVIRRSGQMFSRDHLREATLYASSEPCAMCTAAVFYCGIGRVVFGLPEDKLRALRNLTPHGSGLALSCRAVLARVPGRVVVAGPCLEDEAMAPHADYWRSAV